MKPIVILLIACLATPALAQGKVDDTHKLDPAPKSDTVGKSETASTTPGRAVPLKTDGMAGPRTLQAVRTGNTLLIVGSGQHRKIGGYQSGVPVTQGWSCDAGSGVCVCEDKDDCEDLTLSGNCTTDVSGGGCDTN